MHNDISAVIKAYLKARKEYICLAGKYPELLKGNDNIIGSIGEYIAIKYLEGKGVRVNKAATKSEPGYDLITTTGRKVSVKMITGENKLGRTTRLKDPWNDCILIELDNDYRVKKIGCLNRTNFEKARKENPSWSRNPIIKRTMMGLNGLFSRYGEVVDDFNYL